AKKTYFRLRLAELYLTKEVAWGVELYGAVHSLVKLQFGTKKLEIPNVADTSQIGGKVYQGGDIIARDFFLTPAIPFNGGDAEISAGLIALDGPNHLKSGFKILGSFASLLNVAQVSSVLDLAQPVVTGIQEVMSEGKGALHLGVRKA